MGFVTDLPLINSKCGLFSFVLRSSSSFVGSIQFSWGRELSAQQAASIFFDPIVKLFGISYSILYYRDMCISLHSSGRVCRNCMVPR